jgi:hypothetical protein
MIEHLKKAGCLANVNTYEATVRTVTDNGDVLTFSEIKAANFESAKSIALDTWGDNVFSLIGPDGDISFRPLTSLLKRGK